MEAANVPGFIPAPFGADASSSYIRSIPTEQPVPGNGEASFDLGFPPETFTPPSGGGFAPDGRDFNGLMNQVTALEQWYCSGGPIQWSSTYSTTIGGYAKGAVVASATTLGVFWFSTADNNVTNPDAGGAGWVRWLPAAYYGQDTGSANAYAVTFPIPYVTRVPGTVLYVKIANANTGASTLTPGTGLGATIVQANGTALVAGALVAGMIAAFVDNGTYYQLVNPAGVGQLAGTQTWSGANTFEEPVTAADGTSGTEVVNISQFPSSLSASGYKKYPDPNSASGYYIEQFGSADSYSNETNNYDFPIEFPSAVGCTLATIGYVLESGFFYSLGATPYSLGGFSVTLVASDTTGTLHGFAWTTNGW